MGHSNKTTNVGLPIISDNDKPTWMGDFNFAMYTLDQAVNSGQKLTEAFTALVTKASEDAEFARTEALNAKVCMACSAATPPSRPCAPPPPSGRWRSLKSVLASAMRCTWRRLKAVSAFAP